ncbi:MAG: DUF4304 domain-containing protein [Phycisphaerales bacterium]|nr:DUF4304 domain-containing protein [Phycisphaerales bacterium]
MSATRVVLKDLDELLLPLGFRRQKETWNRQAGSLVDVIDVQVSKAGDTTTVNVGVLDPEIHSQCWGEDPPIFVQEPQCTVRSRLGQLIHGRDVWWPVSSPEIGGAVATGAVPFLERMHAPGGMEEFLISSTPIKARHPHPPPVIHLALLMNKRGDRLGACTLLGELQERVLGAWRTRVREVASRLGCS